MRQSRKGKDLPGQLPIDFQRADKVADAESDRQREARAQELLQPVHRPIADLDRDSARSERISAEATAILEWGKGLRLDDLTARSLAGRGFEHGPALRRYLDADLRRETGDIWKIKGISEVCDRLLYALESGKKIHIVHDYDVDGTCSAAIFRRALSGIAGVRLSSEGSRRFSGGYGLPMERARALAAGDTDVFLFLDFGTTAHEVIDHLKASDREVLVIDHHEPDAKLPAADALVNTKRSDCGALKRLPCTAGLAYLAVYGLFQRMKRSGIKELSEAASSFNHLPLRAYAALATVADVVPLRDFNRALVRGGLYELRKSEDPALVALREVSGLLVGRIKGEGIGFGIGPRINAAGRLEDEGADLVVKLLTATSLREARAAAKRLNELNEKRKEIEKAGSALVKSQLEAQVRIRGELPWALALADKRLHAGVVGIIASRIRELHNRPVFVLAFDEERRVWTGSGRSIESDLLSLKEVLSQPEVAAQIIGGGGHDKAAGVTVAEDKLEDFRAALEAAVAERLRGQDITPRIHWDFEASLIELNRGGAGMLSRLMRTIEPCGKDNPLPRVLVRGVKVASVMDAKTRASASGTGDRYQHLLIKLRDDSPVNEPSALAPGDRFMDALYWFQPGHPPLRPGMRVNLVVELNTEGRHADFNQAAQKIVLKLVAIEEGDRGL